MTEQDLHIPPRASEAWGQVQHYLNPTPVLVIISGPSGVGKDSVVRRMRELAYPFRFVVTATNRCQRPDEVEGVDYYFVSTAEFERMIAQGELFEYAVVYDQYKGIPKLRVRESLASGMDVVMRLDVQGTATMRRLVPQVLTIFLLPPSLEALIQRLRGRGTDSSAQLQRRLEMALQEMGRIEEFDYVVINRDGGLDEAVQQIAAIIATEKCRTARVPLLL